METITNQAPCNKVDELKSEKRKAKSTSWPINAKWIIFLLILSVIVLSVWILENIVVEGDNLLSALVNFSTILSIVLSVSSIAFAGYTSIETGRQFHDMSHAVEEIRTSNRIMSDNYKILLEHYHDTVNKFSEILEQSSQASNRAGNTGVNIGDINNNLSGTEGTAENHNNNC